MPSSIIRSRVQRFIFGYFSLLGTARLMKYFDFVEDRSLINVCCVPAVLKVHRINKGKGIRVNNILVILMTVLVTIYKTARIFVTLVICKYIYIFKCKYIY